MRIKTFSERLKIALNKRGISQAEAARQAGVSQQSLSYIIKNNLHSSKLAPQIALALNINPEWLIYERGKFEETKVYEIPILNTPYLLHKFLNADLDENTTKYTLIESSFGANTFAYLIEPNKLAICCEMNAISTLQYLTLTTSSVTVTSDKKENSFSIFEWRQRHVNF